MASRGPGAMAMETAVKPLANKVSVLTVADNAFLMEFVMVLLAFAMLRACDCLNCQIETPRHGSI